MHKQIESIYLVKMKADDIMKYLWQSDLKTDCLFFFEKYQEKGEQCSGKCNKVVYQKKGVYKKLPVQGSVNMWPS